MISGYFRDESACISLEISGTLGSVEVELTVDTGFTGYISMPASLLNSIGAEYIGSDIMILADQSRARCAVYAAQMEWGGETREVTAIAFDGDPLIGIKALLEHHLHIEITDGGEVEIEPL